MKRFQASKSGGGKKAKQSAPQQSGAASSMKGAGWCSDCWALSQDACRGAHRLVDFPVAQTDVAAEVVDAERRLQQAHQLMQSLKEAVLSSAPVLLADVPHFMGEQCWSVGGGTVRIALASTAPLTTEDVEAVCEALEGLELEYDEDGGMPTAWVDIDGLESVLGKLSDLKGQKLEEGDLLLDAQGHLTVVGEEDAKGKPGRKLLGRVRRQDVSTLNADSCGEGRGCKWASRYHDDLGTGTTLENVRLAD